MFEVRERPAYKGRNPRTGEELQIEASRIPTFRPGARLKAAANGKNEYRETRREK
jgi:DNA-binding protein HU-beta